MRCSHRFYGWTKWRVEYRRKRVVFLGLICRWIPILCYSCDEGVCPLVGSKRGHVLWVSSARTFKYEGATAGMRPRKSFVRLFETKENEGERHGNSQVRARTQKRKRLLRIQMGRAQGGWVISQYREIAPAEQRECSGHRSKAVKTAVSRVSLCHFSRSGQKKLKAKTKKVKVIPSQIISK